MRSPVQIWVAAPETPDFEGNQVFFFAKSDSILRLIFHDPPADPLHEIELQEEQGKDTREEPSAEVLMGHQPVQLTVGVRQI